MMMLSLGHCFERSEVDIFDCTRQHRPMIEKYDVLGGEMADPEVGGDFRFGQPLYTIPVRLELQFSIEVLDQNWR